MRRATSFAALLLILNGCAKPEPAAASSGGLGQDAGLADGASVDATGDAKPSGPAKVDFLWVIDHSPSMAGRQADLTAGFQAFADALSAAGQIDAQMAVVSVQQMADLDLTAPVQIKKVGEFLHKAAIKLPPSGHPRWYMPCTDDTQCQLGATYQFKMAPGAAQPLLCTDANGNTTQTFVNPYQDAACGGDPTCMWRCKSPPNAIHIANENCSVNSYCWRHCKADQECRDAYEPDIAPDQQKMACLHPGGAPSEQSLCQFPPATTDCPPADQLPSVLPHDKLSLFHCLATIGGSQTQESKFEGGLRSAWLALDPKGPNCPVDAAGKPTAACQTVQLLRPDALLVVVVVSDDDDCSVALDISLDNQTSAAKMEVKKVLPTEVWDRCQVFGDRLGANPWLNAGSCEFLKGKAGQSAVCPADCTAMAAGSAEQVKCNADVQTAWPKFAKIDHRFATAADFAWRFKSLKENPNQVLFAAVRGDSVAADPGQVETDRVAYYRSAFKNVAPGQAPYVCGGPRGNAGFGSRYGQVAANFQGNGLVANLCAGTSLDAQLAQVAAFVQAHAVAGAPSCGDKDGDGVADSACGGSDCNDANAAVAPGLKEVCGNGVDDDCDGVTDHDAKYEVSSTSGETTLLSDACAPAQ